MRALVVTEFYPRAEDPVLGVWAHQQAVATRAAGVELEVVVLHRVVPAKRDVAGGPRRTAAALAAKLRQPRSVELDGVPVHYAAFASPPRGATYGSWGWWAAPALRRALRRRGGFDVVHAHNAVPAGDAVRRLNLPQPLVVSVHGGDVFHTAERSLNVARTFAAADLVLANSEGIARASRALGARPVRVVRLGTELPTDPAPHTGPPRLVTIAHLVARKRHADVLAVLPQLPGVAYDVIGDGPERAALEEQARALGVADRVVFHGQLPNAEARARLRDCSVLVLPSTEEAFGVAYVEGMAAGLPAIGLRDEPGPREIAGCGPGMVLVAPDDPVALRAGIERALADRARLGAAARATVAAHFTWERCGRATAEAYAATLGRDASVASGRSARDFRAR